MDTPNLTTKTVRRQFSTGEFFVGKLVAGPVGWCRVKLPPRPGHPADFVDTKVPNLALLPPKVNAKPSAKAKGNAKAKKKGQEKKGKGSRR